MIPKILRPDYTWPTPMRAEISDKTPAIPYVPGKRARWFWGKVHELLYAFSVRYCGWFGRPGGVRWGCNIIDLPFGLLIKWSDRSSVEEVAAMKMARAAGMPVPKVLSVGDHLTGVHKGVCSILMTRLPGFELPNSSETLDVDEEDYFLEELARCVNAMRKWRSPYGSKICSVLGTTIRSTRVPLHEMGPFASEQEMHDYLMSAASSHAFGSKVEFNEVCAHANQIRDIPHRVVFTHGDLKAHNILIGEDGHLSGFIDWESASWAPEYWDFTTAMRFGSGTWWYQVASWMGGDQYKQELACDKSLNRLTVDSYIGF